MALTIDQLAWFSNFRSQLNKAGIKIETPEELQKLMEDGVITFASGKKIMTADLPEFNVEQLQNAIARDGESGKIVLWDNAGLPAARGNQKGKRLGSIAYAQDSEVPVFSADSPAKGNNYSVPFPSNLEEPELSEELTAFLNNLNTALKSDADLDLNIATDGARLKVYFEEDAIPEDRRPDFDFTEKVALQNQRYIVRIGDTAYAEQAKPSRIKALTDAENDIYNTSVSITSMLSKIRAGKKLVSNELHQAYFLMQMAKDGRLMVTKPGELVKDSHPVALREDGSVAVLPSAAQVDEETRSTYSRYYRVGAALAAESSHAEDQEYADSLRYYKDHTFTKRFERDPFRDDSVVYTISDAYNKGLSEEEFLRDIEAMERPAAEDLIAIHNRVILNEENINIPTISAFSRKQQNQREQLSRLAIKNFFSASFRDYNFQSAIYKAVRDGSTDLTDEDVRSIDINRDHMHFLLETETTAAATENNLIAIRHLVGKDVDNSWPEAGDIKAKQYAGVVNDALERIIGFDYESALGLSDEELVNAFPKIFTAYSRLGICKAEIENILRAHEDNQYIDKDLVKQALATEYKYMGFFMPLMNRMRCIANPYYAKYPTDILSGASFNDIYEFADSEELAAANDVYVRVMVQDMRDAYYGEFEAQRSIMASMINEAAERDYDSPVKFFTKDGEPIEGINAFDHLKKGEIVYAAAEGDAGSIRAFSMDVKAGRPVYSQEIAADKDIMRLMEIAVDPYMAPGMAAEKMATYLMTARAELSQAIDSQDQAKLTQALTKMFAAVTMDNVFSKLPDEESQREFLKNQSLEKLVKALDGSDPITKAIENLTKAGADLRTMSDEKFYDQLLDAQAQVGKKAQDEAFLNETDPRVNKTNREVIAELDANAETTYRQMRIASKAADERIRPEFMTGGLVDGNGLKELDANKIHALSLSRDSLQAIVAGMLLSQGLSADQVFGISEESEEYRRNAARAALEALKDPEGYIMIRESLIKGLDRLNKYVGGELDAMKDISTQELCKPENNTLLVAALMQKSMSQEFDKIQGDFPAEKQIRNDFTKSVQDSAEGLASIVTIISSPAKAPLGYTDRDFSAYIASMLSAKMMKDEMEKQRALPENAGKSAEETFRGNLWMVEFYSHTITVGDLGNDILSDPLVQSAGEEGLKKIMAAAADGSFSKDITLSFSRDERGLMKGTMDAHDAIRKALLRKPVDVVEMMSEPKPAPVQKAAAPAPEERAEEPIPEQKEKPAEEEKKEPVKAEQEEEKFVIEGGEYVPF